MRRSQLTLADLLPRQQQQSDGSESAAATAQQLEQRVTEACTVALAHLFGESIAASLLASFRRPVLHLADVQRLLFGQRRPFDVEGSAGGAVDPHHGAAVGGVVASADKAAAGNDAAAGLAGFRHRFHLLLGKFDVNAPLSREVCDWLNAADTRRLLLGKASAGTSTVLSWLPSGGRPRFAFAPHRATLFTITVWVGDLFCIELAITVGAAGVLDASVADGDGGGDGVVSADGDRGGDDAAAAASVTSSKDVQRCLRDRARWQGKLARGLDVHGQDCRAANLLGQGAFAQVFASTYKRERCALKRFDAFFVNLDLDTLDKLMAEIKVLVQVQHPNVVHCLGFFLWDPLFPDTKPCLLLERMEVPLSLLLAAGGRRAVAAAHVLPPDALRVAASLQGRLGIMRQLAAGLVHLHGLTPVVFHRDVKPANVLLSFEPAARGGDGSSRCRVKLADFGIAKANYALATLMGTSSGGAMELTRGAAGHGTPAFMSPEQWTGASTQSSKTDVFGFGLTLFAVVCKTEVPWFDVDKYDLVLQGDAAAYDDVKAIRARVDVGEWPRWPAAVPDEATAAIGNAGGGISPEVWAGAGSGVGAGAASAATRPPSWLTALMQLLLVKDPDGRMPMTAVRDCLKHQQAPDEYLQKHLLPTQGGWQPLTDEALVDKALPPFFADSYSLPDFLAGLRELPAAPSVEDAVLVMADGNCEGFNAQVACFELQKCKQQWRAQLDTWRREGGREALLQLDPQQLLAIRFYTSQGVYGAMNAALRSKERSRVLHFLPFLKLLLQAR